MSYSVTQRVPEIGIRKALGAHRNQVLVLILRGAAKPDGIGLFVGMFGAAAVARVIQSLLFKVLLRYQILRWPAHDSSLRRHAMRHRCDNRTHVDPIARGDDHLSAAQVNVLRRQRDGSWLIWKRMWGDLR